ncbi:scaffold protein involved in DNA repair [Rhinolophus ferrumequinum]|uniref:Scaffold protein involved in DNA repair n=1 Tax=Rhinolophus ferrumequinum TaxID=59479 RepID=A0A7J7VF33_RHIFE|nr:scaffold protein involved in DNA repair [Rhinolophus ferrumequinum]
MSHGGNSRGQKRKRNWDIGYSSFPGEHPWQFRRAGLRTVGTAASLSESWLRCEEGFQDTSGTPLLTAEKKTFTEKDIELLARSKKETTTSKSTSGLTDITWSSSESDLSDEGKTFFKSMRDNGHEPQFVEWESDSDREHSSEYSEFEDSERAVEISDCASCASSSLTSEERASELPKVEDLVY